MENNNKDVREIFKQLENIHYPAGPNYSKIHKAKALLTIKNNELEAIYSLTESHAPSLRFTATNRYEKSFSSLTDAFPLNKNNFSFLCNTISTEDKIQIMLNQMAEMPKEWTIIQLTSQHSIKENLEVNINKFYTNPLHVTVFNCGQKEVTPFSVTVDVPKDHINGKTIEIRQEMHSILEENAKLSKFAADTKKFKLLSERESYKSAVYSINKRLEDLVRQIQNSWLSKWRCLFIGKFVNEEIENTIETEINNILTLHKCTEISSRTKQLLKYLAKGGDTVKLLDIKMVLKSIFSDSHQTPLCTQLLKCIQSLSTTYNFHQQKRHPVILIVDEKLDTLPWEMIDVLQDHPVSRMASFHFTYALFKEHEKSIVNGLKVNVDPKKGKYIINPGLDLKNMETRLINFLNYWCPAWSGLAGAPPSESEFHEMLRDNDILIYSGHGSGTQFISGDKIQRMRVNAVVLLFGCGSVCLTQLGPQVEMYSAYQMYLIACSPCVVGMLWTVSDLSTDILTTDLFSIWLPSSAETHWKFVDRKKWELSGLLNFNKKAASAKNEALIQHEPELLRALCMAKKNAKQYWTKAACVVRGLPVQINS